MRCAAKTAPRPPAGAAPPTRGGPPGGGRGAQPRQLPDHRRVQRPAVGELVAGELVARYQDFPDPAGQDRPLLGSLLRTERGPVDRRVFGLVLLLTLRQQDVDLTAEPAELV